MKETFRIALLPLLGYPTTSHGVNLHISHYHIASLGTATCTFDLEWLTPFHLKCLHLVLTK